MRITFLGAAEMVTGSCYLLEFENLKLLVDCGMFQGGSESVELNLAEFKFNAAEIDCLLLTHAHIDHSGRIPQLYKRGFTGKIITTKPTAELCRIMLPDSAFIQEMEAEWLSRKRQRAGKHAIEPLYTVRDAQESLKLFEPVSYDEMIELGSGISVRFRDAGHILGSAMLEMWIQEGSEKFKIVFSGDLGNRDVPLMKEPTLIEDADYLVIESTYGNRLHKDTENKVQALSEIIEDTVKRGGNIVIPSFAIERTQEILYILNMLKESKDSKIRDIPVYVDSPLAINATKIFETYSAYLDEEALGFVKKGDNPFDFPNLTFTETADESKAINTSPGSSIIISASGMCEAGRIKHHLKHNLWREDSSVVFVGYQAKNSLGRRIKDGEDKVKIFGEDIGIRCKIYSIEGFSGHADQTGLLDWIGSFTKKPSKIFITHGEDEAQTEFSRLIKENFGLNNEIPKLGQSVELTASSEKQVVIEERYGVQKESALKRIERIRGGFPGILGRLQDYITANESIKLDKLSYILEKVEDDLSDIDKEIVNK